MATYDIDGVAIDPQPTSHEWDAKEKIGNDGDGAPVYAKYRAVTLRCDVILDGQDWEQYTDGATHSITLPAPGTVDDFTTYTTVYVDNVENGRINRKKGLDGLTMRVIRITV